MLEAVLIQQIIYFSFRCLGEKFALHDKEQYTKGLTFSLFRVTFKNI